MRSGLRVILMIVLGLVGAVMTAAILFVSAGRWDLPMFWATVGVTGAVSIASLVSVDPGLIRERGKPGPGGKDRLTIYMAKLLTLATLVMAGLDVGRHHFSDTVPLILQILALVGFTLGIGLMVRCMAVNPFFSSVVRFQQERGHRVIADGPYRFVRHPGYAGTMVGMPCFALALGSWLSVLPMLVLNVVVLRRLRIEDRFLRANLLGYPTYAERVPYKLIPGVW